MLEKQLKVGGWYVVSVSGVKTVVRLDTITDVPGFQGRRATKRFAVMNITTTRRISFRSAAKFQREATPKEYAAAVAKAMTRKPAKAGPYPDKAIAEGDDRADPTTVCTMPKASPPTIPTITPAPETVGNGWTVGGKPLGGPSPLPAPSADGTVAGYTPTEEQEAILAAARQPGLTCLVVAAGAGAGKTSTLKMLEETLPGRGQYTAFNSSLVAESRSKFKRARCNTTHSLAFGAVGRRYAHRLGGQRILSSEVARILGITALTLEMPAEAPGAPPRKKTLSPGNLASMVTGAIKRFCQSADAEVQLGHIRRPAGVDYAVDGVTVYTNSDRVREYLLPFARAAWADLANPDGKLPFTHDCYVKVWQLGKGQDAPVISADYILLDESQDSAPVLLDIIKRQKALVVLVGDDNQRIYEWRGAVNAMAAFPNAPRRLLSQSFRFGQGVADVANSILAGLDEPTDLVMKGLATVPSRVYLPDETPAPPANCVLCRTNAAAVGTVLSAMGEGKRPHLIGGGAEVVKFVKAARDLQAGRGTSHPDLCCFESWTEVQAFVKEEDGEDLKTMVKLIDEFRPEPILKALEGMPKEEDADLIVCTAHKSKGREWDVVRLAGDFPPVSKMDDADRRLLYVAATRARLGLDLSVCPPFITGVDKETGEVIRPITVRFTTPRPTDGATPQTSTPVATEPSAPATPKQHTPATSFGWGRYAGEWVVRGPKGASGSVTVNRKDGSISTEMLGAVVKSYPEADLYRVNT